MGILNETNEDNMVGVRIEGIKERLGDDFLTKAEGFPNYVFSLTQDVKRENYIFGVKNKCERNSYNYVIDAINENRNVFPVGGYAFTDSYYPIEHWWVYDQDNEVFLEVTPLEVDDIVCYAGIVGFDVRQKLIDNGAEWDKPFDIVNFFKGGHVKFNFFR